MHVVAAGKQMSSNNTRGYLRVLTTAGLLQIPMCSSMHVCCHVQAHACHWESGTAPTELNTGPLQRAPFPKQHTGHAGQ